MKNRMQPFKKTILSLALGAVVLGSFVTGCAPSTQVSRGTQSPSTPMQAASLPNPASVATLRDLDTTFADISETASKAVVHIRAGGQRSNAGQMVEGGQGSGFIYKPDGWIVTNHHVVAGYDEVTVILNDGRELKGKVYPANDAQLDLAVVKIEAKDLPTLTFANSNSVRVGQFAIAVGSPFGLENSVTIGHVSASNREGEVSDNRFGMRGYTGMIQTDASINPGNSGGPLINIDGQVIGVNTTIFSTSGSNAGIGFSIPANVVQVVADKLISTKKFDRGFIGIELADLKPYQRQELGVTGGALIMRDPTGETPGAAAGLKKDDVITAIEGNKITNQLDLRVALYRHSAGESVDVEYLRKGQSKTTRIKLAKPEPVVANNTPQTQNTPEGLEEFFRRQNPRGSGPDFFPPSDTERMPRTGTPRLGVSIQDLDASSRTQYGVPAGTAGVIVMMIQPGSFAANAGLQPGDVITAINGKTIKSAEELRAAMADVKWGEKIAVKIVRGKEGSKTFEIDLK